MNEDVYDINFPDFFLRQISISQNVNMEYIIYYKGQSLASTQ